MELYAFIPAVLFVVLLLYVCINLYIKNKKYEKLTSELYDTIEELEAINEEYADWFTFISDKVKSAYDNIKRIDHKGYFESEDEVGFTFVSLKEVIDNLNKLVNKEDKNTK